jgi:predicted flavoprotein YhiN
MRRLTLTEYETYDKIISENEPKFLQQRLDNFGLKDYRSWFSDTNTWHIRDVIKKYKDTLAN